MSTQSGADCSMRIFPLSETQFNLYAVDLHNQLFANGFRTREELTGRDILIYSTHDQVNRFVLLQVYREWQQFNATLAHPYFDLRAEAVQEALTHLQNTASQHIRIRKPDFKPLSERAVQLTLRLLLNPLDTLLYLVFGAETQLSPEALRRLLPYFVDYRFILDAVVAYAEHKQLPQVDRNTFTNVTAKAVELFEVQEQQPFDQYRRKAFLKLTGVDLEMVVAKGAPKPATEATTEPQPAPLNELAPGTTARKGMKVTVIPEELVERGERPEPSTIGTSIPAAERLADKYQPQTTVGSSHPLLNLEQIPLHKQFQFTQKLFAGNSNKFRETLESVNALTSRAQLDHYLKTRILNMPEVPKDDKVTAEFLQLLYSRFGESAD